MLNKIGKSDIVEFANKYCYGLKGLNKTRFIQETLGLKRQIRGTDAQTPEHQKLLDAWNDSLNDNDPDYSVYSQYAILQDIWACWSMYSRAHLKSLSAKKCGDVSVLEALGEVNSILDIGNGIGYSTAALKQLFPLADVVGYNVIDSFQYKICERVAVDYHFAMTGDLEDVGHVDLLFASEYFEHYEYPVEHLEEVIELTEPRNIIVANSFGTEAIGHFAHYKYKNSVLTFRQIRKAFSDFLKDNNYVKQNTTCWNDRPHFWQRR